MRSDDRPEKPLGMLLPRYAAPAALEARIRESLADEWRSDASAPPPSSDDDAPDVWRGRATAQRALARDPWRLGRLAALLLLVVSAPGALGYWLGAERSGGDDLLVASHVRSLLADHLTDVASADGHTVKPWLAARLDYSPDVIDLTTDGVPLEGGRLDYLAGRRVAVLAYRLRSHIINVYIAPAGSFPWSIGRGAEARGYHVQRWTTGAMEHVAISDVNEAELARFAGMVRERAKAR